GSNPARSRRPLIDPLFRCEKLRQRRVSRPATEVRPGRKSMENEWDVVRNDRGWPVGDAGMGILRITLLFRSAAIALALLIAPIRASQTRAVSENNAPYGIDEFATGSIGSKNGNVYTIHKSVLQSSPDAICVIQSNGRRTGDC